MIDFDMFVGLTIEDAKEELAKVFFECARYERPSMEWTTVLDMFCNKYCMNDPKGDVVITTNDAGHIVAVTRQNEEGVVLSTLAISEPVGGRTDYPELSMKYAMHSGDGVTACWDSEQVKAYADATYILRTTSRPE